MQPQSKGAAPFRPSPSANQAASPQLRRILLPRGLVAGRFMALVEFGPGEGVQLLAADGVAEAVVLNLGRADVDHAVRHLRVPPPLAADGRLLRCLGDAVMDEAAVARVRRGPVVRGPRGQSQALGHSVVQAGLQVLLLGHQVVIASQIPLAGRRRSVDRRDAEAGHVGVRLEVPPALASGSVRDDAVSAILLGVLVAAKEQIVVVVPGAVVPLPPPGTERSRLVLLPLTRRLRLLDEGLGHGVCCACCSAATSLEHLAGELKLHVDDPFDQVLLLPGHRRTLVLANGVPENIGALTKHRSRQGLQLLEGPQVQRLAIDLHLPRGGHAGGRELGKQLLSISSLSAQDALLLHVRKGALSADQVPVRIDLLVVPLPNGAQLRDIPAVLPLACHLASGPTGSHPPKRYAIPTGAKTLS
mmetsp:Transcript_343/g.1532  ORF Transcript_343/g.1532 Transcript_343/m.1532 type:complete len:416 (+) Transcript_343:23-1270(+)